MIKSDNIHLNSLHEAAGMLKTQDNFLILTHTNPDGDTLGSACALCLCLRQMGKKANVFLPAQTHKKYQFITDLAPNDGAEVSFVVSVDVADDALLDKSVPQEYKSNIKLSIDHHQSRRLFAENTYVESDSASCAEIIFNLIELLGAKIDKNIANCLFTGVSTDTGCFRYSNVTARSHEIAAKLIKCGAEAAKINEMMFETKTFAQLELQKLCLEKMQLHFGGKMALFIISKVDAERTGCEEGDFDLIVALSRQIEGVSLGLTLKQKNDGSIKVSARSDESIDAAAFCARFGGGGHKRAAGCSFDCSIERAMQMLLEEASTLFEGEKQ